MKGLAEAHDINPMVYSLLTYLKANLHPEIQAKIPTSALKELLSHCADWAYGQRYQAVQEFVNQLQTGVEQGQPIMPPTPLVKGDPRSAVKPVELRSSFLDALEGIG